MSSTATTRIVITGLGATTPLGGDVATTWQSLLAGRSGIATMPYEWVEEFDLPIRFAGMLAAPADTVLQRVEVRRLDPSSQYALIAAREAWADAGAPEIDPLRLAVTIGTGIGGVQTLMSQWDVLRQKGARRIFPLAVPMLMPNAPSATVSLELHARAGGHTPVSACASGAEGIGLGMELIRSGRADIVVAGGTESAIHPLPLAGFAAMQAMSTRNDDPQAASRPYDTARDGFVLGEGAAVMVLESFESATARGATIYAELASVGMTADAHHIAAPEPDGEGGARAMLQAVADGGFTARDIVHINAHATSTPVGDVAECNGIRRAFGAEADHMAVSATKSMTGHLLGAAGALEAIFTVKALQERVAPAQINLDDRDPAVDLDLVCDGPRTLPPGDIVALDNSFGFGGANVVLAFKSV